MTASSTLVIASDNAGKIREIRHYFEAFAWHLKPQSAFGVPSIEETGLSFIENALLKARHAARYSELPALADDSGLVVDALGGEPGIYSARYAGAVSNDARNIEKLLDRTAHLPDEKRHASFYCALAFVRHANDPVPIISVGQWKGQLLTHPRGTQGFGYDPIFYIPELGCTAAEIPYEQKNAISHRGQAMETLLTYFRTVSCPL